MTKEQITDELTRRQIIQITGTVGIGGLAGCQSATAPGGGENNSSSQRNNGSRNSGTGGNTGGKLKFAQVKSPIEFDPIVLNDVPSAQITSLVFEPLYSFDKTGTKTIPRLASKQPEVEKGGKRYIIPLRENAKFHNGDPVTAEDVAYSFTAPVREETENAADFNMIDTTETIDDTTIQFDLKYPFGAFNSYLAANIVPKSVRENNKQKFSTKQPIGAGPFTFEGWQEGNFARVKRWDDYWSKPMTNISQVEFIPVEEGTTRTTTLKTNENDIIEEIPPKSWDTVKNMGNASIDASPGIGYFYLAFNCKEGPTADPEVRKAIDYAVSMDQVVSNFVEPTGVRQYSPLPNVVVNEWDMPIEKWKKIPHEKDVDKAKSILDKNDNVPKNWNAKIIVPPDDKREQIATSVANGLKEAGYSATVQRLDWGTFLSKYVTGDPADYNMYTLGWSGRPDPDSFLYFLFAQSQAGVGQGIYYQNDDVNDAILTARKSTDRSKRKKLYVQAITTLLEDRANLPAYNLKNSFGVNNYVNDFTSHPVGSTPMGGFSIVSDYNNVSVNK